jgi:hypothetical protein
MPRVMPHFEMDFVFAAETERRVRQATQDTRLDTPMLPSPHDHFWEQAASGVDHERIGDSLPDEACATVWEITLERL